jgi:hypothetical protein
MFILNLGSNQIHLIEMLMILRQLVAVNIKPSFAHRLGHIAVSDTLKPTNQLIFDAPFDANLITLARLIMKRAISGKVFRGFGKRLNLYSPFNAMRGCDDTKSNRPLAVKAFVIT